MDMRRYHYTDIDPVSGTQVFRGFAPPTNLDARQRRQARAAHQAEVQLRIRLELWQASTPSAALATDYHTEADVDHSTVTRTMTRYSSLAALLFASRRPRAWRERTRSETSRRTDPPARSQVLQLRRQRAGREFLRRRDEDHGDPSTTGAESTTASRTAASAREAYYNDRPRAARADGQDRGGDRQRPRDRDVTTTSRTESTTRSILSGFYNTTTKNVDAFVVEDNYPIRRD